jgi:hypothetical protein
MTERRMSGARTVRRPERGPSGPVPKAQERK